MPAAAAAAAAAAGEEPAGARLEFSAT